MTDNISELKLIAENRIFHLETVGRALRAELIDKESFNAAAWAEYGSELCGGEMVREEKNIQANIDDVKATIALLRKFIDGQLNIYREEKIRKNLSEVVGQIATLQNSQKLIEGELSEIEKVKHLLN